MNVYDFDGTIYNGDCTVDFFLYALRKKPSLIRFVPKQAFAFIRKKLNKIDTTEFKEQFFSFLSKTDVETTVENFWKKHERKIYKWYIDQKSEDDIIISASPEFLLKPICNKLEIKYLIATKMDCNSGKIAGKNCKGEEKVNRLKSELAQVKINSFYSDSDSDIPLAKLADKAFLVKKGKIIEWIFTPT